MKAVILAGGRGARLDTGNKCMMMFRGKPILEYSIINAVNAGVDEIIILVGYHADKVINYFSTKYNSKEIFYAFQSEQKGIVHAISCCHEYIGSDDFLLMLGDEIINEPTHSNMIKWYESQECFGVCGVVNVKDKKRIAKNYSILTGNHTIHRLVEKPSFFFNNMMGTGNCILNNGILDYINSTPVNVRRGRDEKELVDLVQCAIDNGKKIDWFRIGSDYENVNDESCLKNMLNWGEDIIV